MTRLTDVQLSSWWLSHATDDFDVAIGRELRERRAQEDWQPIETAPKDGTLVLLWWPFWCNGRPTIGRFGYKGIQQWIAPEPLDGGGDPPTHWRPLPAAPLEK